jgi:sec-independent protein translocase protein TatB
MFSNLGFGELVVIALLGLVIFGPDRLPKAASDAARLIRRSRAMADSTLNDFKAELPPEV